MIFDDCVPIFKPFPYIKTRVIFFWLTQKMIKWEKQCKYAKHRIVSLKTVPPEMWKAQYSGVPAGISNPEGSVFRPFSYT
jgi:hypothetical protein